MQLSLIILLAKGAGGIWTIAPVDSFSSQDLGWIPSQVSLGMRKVDLHVHHFEAGELTRESVQVLSNRDLLFFIGSWVFWT